MKAISLSETHIATGGVHSVGLFDKRRSQSASSRTSADTTPWTRPSAMRFPKKVDFGRTYVACTGRISSDMALKCSVAGIPIIVSRGATTSLAISIAERTGLCIIGFLRGKRLSVYTNRERFKID